MIARPGQQVSFATVVNEVPAPGALRLRLVSIGAGGNAYGPSNAGIVADVDNPLLFEVTIPLPADLAPGRYSIGWDTGGTPWFDNEVLTVQDGPLSSTIATVEQLRKMLATQGTISQGAQIDGLLLELLLSAAGDRFKSQLPERTLDIVPPLDEATGLDTAPPVEVRIPLFGARTIVQVPDLREVESITIANASPVNAIDLPEARPPLSSYLLMRRARHACANWVKFPTAITGDELVIVGRWGPADLKIGAPLEVNSSVRDAILVWAAVAFHKRTARYGDRVQDPSGAGTDYFRTLPSDVGTVIEAFRIPGL